ncbi:MAG: sulfurtransferase TusA family protein [Gammaproteobacteria bacterium]|nr:sulfurtransferase TusA family protein [Gammaproteobacteria bacterium]
MNQTAESETTREIDLSGLNCPLPVLKTKAALARLGKGERLRVIATHPDSVREFEMLCKSPDLEMESFEESGEQYVYRIIKLK